MNKRNLSGTRLFFIEFFIVLFFFFLISSICLRIFAQATTTTNRSAALYSAQNAAASVIEDAKSSASFTDKILYYDNNFISCEESASVYTLTFTCIQDLSLTPMQHLSATVTDSSGKIIYELETAYYQPHIKKEVFS